MWKATTTRCQAFICTGNEHHSPTTGYQIAELSESIKAWSAGHTIWGLCWGRMSAWITGPIDVVPESSPTLSASSYESYEKCGGYIEHKLTLWICASFIAVTVVRDRRSVVTVLPSLSHLIHAALSSSQCGSHMNGEQNANVLLLCVWVCLKSCVTTAPCILVLQHLCWLLTQVTGCGINVGYTQKTRHKLKKLSQ